MALQLRSKFFSEPSKLIGTTIAIFAFVIQPLVALDVPSAFAVSLQPEEVQSTLETPDVVSGEDSASATTPKEELPQSDSKDEVTPPQSESKVAAKPAQKSVNSLVATPAEVTITNEPELTAAINDQHDGQTWTIESGDYAIDRNNTHPADGQTGWYLPITANNLTIKGVGNPTLYGNEYSSNGSIPSQDLVAVFGNDVKISGLTLMPAPDPNKTLEVMGNNFTLENTVITPNTKVDDSVYDDNITNPADNAFAKQWGGSIYFSNATGTLKLDSVTVQNGGMSDRSPGATLEMNNFALNYATNIDNINSFRYGLHGNPTTGAPVVTYSVNSTLNNLDSVLAGAQDGDTVNINSDLTYRSPNRHHKSVNNKW